MLRPHNGDNRDSLSCPWKDPGFLLQSREDTGLCSPEESGKVSFVTSGQVEIQSIFCIVT